MWFPPEMMEGCYDPEALEKYAKAYAAAPRHPEGYATRRVCRACSDTSFIVYWDGDRECPWCFATEGTEPLTSAEKLRKAE